MATIMRGVEELEPILISREFRLIQGWVEQVALAKICVKSSSNSHQKRKLKVELQAQTSLTPKLSKSALAPLQMPGTKRKRSIRRARSLPRTKNPYLLALILMTHTQNLMTNTMMKTAPRIFSHPSAVFSRKSSLKVQMKGRFLESTAKLQSTKSQLAKVPRLENRRKNRANSGNLVSHPREGLLPQQINRSHLG